MDKPKKPKAVKTDFITLAVPRAFATRLKVVAAHRDLTIIAAIDKYLTPVIERECRKCIEAANVAHEAGA